MSDEYVTTVRVHYKHQAGWHVFTSPDVPGLYVTSQNPVVAYDDVPVALKALMDMDYSCEWEVTRAESYEEFVRRILGEPPEWTAPALESGSFVVRGRKGERPAHTY